LTDRWTRVDWSALRNKDASFNSLVFLKYSVDAALLIVRCHIPLPSSGQHLNDFAPVYT
jgi:hypothetical protein